MKKKIANYSIIATIVATLPLWCIPLSLYAAYILISEARKDGAI